MQCIYHLSRVCAFPLSDCEDCDSLYHGDCPIHGPLMTLDANSGYDEASRTFTDLPVPAELTVRPSSIPNAGLGVFAKKFILRGVKVGPYEGKHVWKDQVDEGTDTSYMWEVRMLVYWYRDTTVLNPF